MTLCLIYRTVWIRLIPVLRPQSYYSKAWRVTKRLRAGRKKQKVNVRAFSVDICAINVQVYFLITVPRPLKKNALSIIFIVSLFG